MAVGSLPSSTLAYADDVPRAAAGSRAWRKLTRNPAALIGALILTVVIGAALAAPWVAPHDPAKQSPEMWTQFLNGQAPVVQGLMGNYLDQSRQMFLQMQEQMAKAGTLFPGMPGFTPPKR